MQAHTEYKQLNDCLYTLIRTICKASLKQTLEASGNTSMNNGKNLDCPLRCPTAYMRPIPKKTLLICSARNLVTSSPDIVNEAIRDVPRLSTFVNQIIITDDMVAPASKELKSSTGSGPDGIPSLVLKRCAETIASPLARVFNLSLASGVFPNCWKQSYVFPVFKKGSKQLVSNYRGKAALSVTSKLFEVIILQKLVQSYAHYISPDQHGFMPKRSTTTNLACFTSFI